MSEVTQSTESVANRVHLQNLEDIGAGALNSADVPAYKRCIAEAHDDLKNRFERDQDAREIVEARAQFVDRLLIIVWNRSEISSSAHALLAVGGYGRGELHPFSDVDIAILLKKRLGRSEKREIERFVTFLWDIGLEVGHSVRTIKESVRAAGEDLTIMTNLMEARLLAGPPVLHEELKKKTTPKKMWSASEFFTAKLEEQKNRHAKFNDAFQALEPNIKENPGGLRDIQVIAWTANRHFDAADLRGLVAEGFLTADEGDALRGGENFLWKIRCSLHFIAGRREDRLLFEHQKAIAIQLGYADDGSNRAVEHFMKDYYRTVRELASLNEMLLGLFREAILEKGARAKVVAVNRRFQLRNNEIETTDSRVFSRTPTSLLEIFLLLQQDQEIKGIRASTIRQLRANLHLIDIDFRNDLRARSLFMEIIRQPRRIGHELQRMHRYGVLSAYLPVYAAVEGLMQFDLFHIYTVDEHSLFVVRNMRYFSFPRHENDQSELVMETIGQIPKLELLYVAGMFHDIAKGRGGDHSELGAEDAVEFCRTHGLSNMDTHMIAWLVRNHLVMSTTAQSKDIYDSGVVREFAALVGDIIHLDYLFLLTIADIRGTNPDLWTSWKESLLSQLYVATRRVLESDDLEISQNEEIEKTKAEALTLLANQNFSTEQITGLWDTLGSNYFLRHRPEEIAWHTEVVLNTNENDLPVVSVRGFEERGGTAVFVFEKDVDGLFALTTSALDRLRLDVQDARIITSQSGYTLDTYMVTEAGSGEPVTDERRTNEIASKIAAAIRGGEISEVPLAHGVSRKLEHFTVPVSVNIDFDKIHNCTVMEVVATDRPGLLAKIGGALEAADVRLHDARIATFGLQAEDYFYITDRDNNKLDSDKHVPLLKQAVLEALREQ